jgi:pyruvate dehydrogenase E1 component
MDEPETIGAIGLAAREELDNLTFVVNCNLQRLDGPVRGNGKVIQELEAFFRGAGWNVVKVVWGREWDPLLAADTDGALVNLMNITPDGDYQTYKAESGAYVREHFFGRDPRTRKMVEAMTDDEIWNLKRGGHDYRKLYAAYKAATDHTGQPTVILAKTIKGWTLGTSFEARNATHQMKKLTLDDLKAFRDRLDLDIPDATLESDPYRPPYFHPGEKSDEWKYMRERRLVLGGPMPSRRFPAKPLEIPPTEAFKDLKKGSGKQKVATTMAFVRLLKDLMKDKRIGPRWVPIIPDEARTFGMDSLFPTAKIYSPHGQQYTPVDRELFLSYREATSGQILHEGINEAGSVASFTAAGTSYATHGEPMIPLYIFYSMFGFQRTADGLWAAADQMARGFLLGATAGRTTLNGEGLQHEDGHSHLIAATNPAVVAYDPAFGFELAYITENALHRMYGENSEDIFYYLTVYNEPIVQPAEPSDVDVEGLLKGLYRYAPAPAVEPLGSAPKAQLLASGTGMQWALKAQQLLAQDWGVAADVWSATSWTELRRDAVAAEEWNLLHPGQSPRVPYVTRALTGAEGPVVAVSDFMRAVPDLIARWVPTAYTSLGTDGFGMSDTRHALRRHFHVDAENVVVATLRQLALAGEVPAKVAEDAARKYAIDDVTAAPVGETGGDT